MKIKHLILGLSAATLLAGCGGSSNESSTSTTSGSEESSTSQRVEITSEQWDAAFGDVLNNYTYTCVINNTKTALVELNDDGLHGASYNSSGEVYKDKEEYIQWNTDKKYVYFYDTNTNQWKKTETTEDYASKEYQINYYKTAMTFIGRFSDFSYDASKGGYFASTAKTTEVEVDGDTNGGYEMTNVLVKFNNVKITEINFRYYNNNLDGGTFADYSVTSIGSTTFDFPIIYE